MTQTPDDNFSRRGRVTKVEPLAGSFAQVTVENVNGSRVHTCGLSDSTYEIRWPRVGEIINVTGVIRNGRWLTNEWRLIV